MTLQPKCEDVETAEGVALTVTGVAQVNPEHLLLLTAPPFVLFCPFNLLSFLASVPYGGKKLFLVSDYTVSQRLILFKYLLDKEY